MNVVTFGYKTSKAPQGAFVIDCRVLPNPYFPGITLAQARARLEGHPVLNRLVYSGVAYAKTNPGGMIACGCSYGKHRSVVVAEKIRAALERS